MMRNVVASVFDRKNSPHTSRVNRQHDADYRPCISSFAIEIIFAGFLSSKPRTVTGATKNLSPSTTSSILALFI
jgi:hypothetical protein